MTSLRRAQYSQYLPGCGVRLPQSLLDDGDSRRRVVRDGLVLWSRIVDPAHEVFDADSVKIVPVTPVTSIPYVPRRDFIYDFLRSRGPADLYVDVGAASGEISERIAGGAAHVLAFEPFPNNARLFRKRLANHSHVRLVEKAVSSRRGRTTLFVGSTVQGDEPGWDDQVGYSSVGKIGTSVLATLNNYASIGLAALRRQRGATLVRVQTTTLDSELSGRVVDFLKVDVQGAECRVLEGAESALKSQKIKLMYLEWSGDAEVERRLDEAGYSIFDSVYVGSGSDEARRNFERSGFEVIDLIPLSIGQPALEMVYRGSGSEIGPVLRELNGVGQWIQTDLIALPSADEGEFAEFLRTA
ncbi:FkbM family methyltransferase [Mycobacterium sp. Aquia_216]|uniref:FkbM family methyltransferase n=1 Tax=Mycobacterium sp. Aquia_216 TaxID=2991729 RepID=UPI00227AA083|nr:FkbM family methyltransferase [Mycobacterium sp. Aquia_216]WAJ47330.1 FkbM family methyltransferase [Mycobacterium sp. Aquia_216]